MDEETPKLISKNERYEDENKSLENSLKRKHSLEKSIDSVPEIQSFQCDICNRYFKYKHQVKEHKNSVHLSKKRFKCSTEGCNFSCFYKKEMNNHMKAVHLNLKTFQCNLCDKSFSRKNCKDRHVKRVHEGIKNSKCHYCKLRFGDIQILRRHIERRHPLKIDDFSKENP